MHALSFVIYQHFSVHWRGNRLIGIMIEISILESIYFRDLVAIVFNYKILKKKLLIFFIKIRKIFDRGVSLKLILILFLLVLC